MAKRGGFPGAMPGNMNNLMKQAHGMKMSTYNKVVERLVEICTAHKAELEAEEGTKNDGAAEE